MIVVQCVCLLCWLLILLISFSFLVLLCHMFQTVHSGLDIHSNSNCCAVSIIIHQYSLHGVPTCLLHGAGMAE